MGLLSRSQTGSFALIDDCEFWAVAHMRFPEGAERDEARRAVALNFCCGPDGILKDYKDQFPAILALLKGSESNVVPFVPKAVPDDASG